MRHLIYAMSLFLSASLLSTVGGDAVAAVSESEAEQLKTTLTPFGAERVGFTMDFHMGAYICLAVSGPHFEDFHEIPVKLFASLTPEALPEMFSP